MTFLRLTFLLLPIVLLDRASPHHVVFEDIDEMAGALSYIHAIVPVNISRLAQAVQTFRYDLHVLQEIYTKNRLHTGSTHDDWFHQRIVELFQMALSDADAMFNDINGLQSTLPPVVAESHLRHEEHEYWIRHLSPFAIISGVIGTLMGWFTQQ
jgi:hypothetical protein